MHPEGCEIVYQEAATHQWRRVRFEPTSDGYVRETARWTGIGWDVTGSEPVSNITIDAPTGAAATNPGP